MPAVAEKKPVTTLQFTAVFDKNAKAYLSGKRRAMNEGGTRSSKTWSILQVIFMIAQAAKKPTLISIVSESLPHLKIGAMRDWFTMLGESQDNNPKWSKSNFTYTVNQFAHVEFFGADDVGKAHGPTRQFLFINEGNNVPWETARQLDIRTEIFTFADWNPVGEFWAHQYETTDGTKVAGWRYSPDSEYIHSTYQDAKDVLPQSVVDNIESNRDKDPNWWNVYGLGNLGKIEGCIHPSFQKVKKLPDGEVFYGLDFGFSGDQVGLVANVIIGDCLYSHQLIYEKGLTNPQLAQQMDLRNVSHTQPIFADSAEPKSIQELKDKGFNVLPTEKGPGSLEYGIQKVNQYFQFWTEESTEAITEQRNYRWVQDRMTGQFTDKMTGADHLMDARRYALAGKRMHRNTNPNWRISTSIRRGPSPMGYYDNSNRISLGVR
jgi:phage terminase large subunit